MVNKRIIKYIRKVIFSLVIIAVLVSCFFLLKQYISSKDVLTQDTAIKKTNNEFTIEHESYYDTIKINKIKKEQFCYDKDILDSEDKVINYANNIMTTVLEKELEKYKIINIQFDKKKGIYVVSYFIDEYIAGGDINIALKKCNGEILAIWFGE